jgi:hypothetical protein
MACDYAPYTKTIDAPFWHWHLIRLVWVMYIQWKGMGKKGPCYRVVINVVKVPDASFFDLISLGQWRRKRRQPTHVPIGGNGKPEMNNNNNRGNHNQRQRQWRTSDIFFFSGVIGKTRLQLTIWAKWTSSRGSTSCTPLYMSWVIIANRLGAIFS